MNTYFQGTLAHVCLGVNFAMALTCCEIGVQTCKICGEMELII